MESSKRRKRRLVNRVSHIPCEEYEAFGSGNELCFKTEQLNGSALEVDRRLLHMVMLRNDSRAMN